MSLELIRHDDWQERLSRYFESVADRRFEWGQHDCALFAASAVEAMTGVDILAEFRGQYSSRVGAAKALREIGQGTLIKTFNHRLGRWKRPALAQRGDIVMFQNSAGICCGSFSRFIGEYDEAFQPILSGQFSKSSLIVIPTLACSRAWAVAHG